MIVCVLIPPVEDLMTWQSVPAYCELTRIRSIQLATTSLKMKGVFAFFKTWTISTNHTGAFAFCRLEKSHQKAQFIDHNKNPY